MPKYFQYKVAGYFLYFTSYCIVECMHVHASDRKLTEAGSAKFFVKNKIKVSYFIFYSYYTLGYIPTLFNILSDYNN